MSMDALGIALTRLAGKSSGVRLVRVTIAAAAPLTVTLPDGTTVPALPIKGLTYTANAAGLALLAEGSIPPVLPL